MYSCIQAARARARHFASKKIPFRLMSLDKAEKMRLENEKLIEQRLNEIKLMSRKSSAAAASAGAGSKRRSTSASTTAITVVTTTAPAGDLSHQEMIQTVDQEAKLSKSVSKEPTALPQDALTLSLKYQEPSSIDLKPRLNPLLPASEDPQQRQLPPPPFPASDKRDQTSAVTPADKKLDVVIDVGDGDRKAKDEEAVVIEEREAEDGDVFEDDDQSADEEDDLAILSPRRRQRLAPLLIRTPPSIPTRRLSRRPPILDDDDDEDDGDAEALFVVGSPQSDWRQLDVGDDAEESSHGSSWDTSYKVRSKRDTLWV